MNGTVFTLPDSLKKVISVIENAGYEAYCVGGAVRDILMGKTPDDYDVASSAMPEIIEKLFEKTVPTGIKHGTVTVIEDGDTYEVTKYRIDGNYADHRKPDRVTFTDDFTLDLMRRDFTVNAIGYSEKRGIYDPFSGRNDIKNKIIRTVGDPYSRFSEDALRILRGVRFSAVLGFSIEENTLKAITEKSEELSFVSPERISAELIKTLMSERPQELGIIINAGGFSHLGVAHFENGELISKCKKSPPLRFAVFCILTDCDCKSLCKKLKFSNAFTKTASAYYELLIDKDFTVEKAKMKVGDIPYSEICFSAHAHGIVYNVDMTEEIKKLQRAYENNEPYCEKMLAIDGDDLKSLGLTGKSIGKAQKILLELVLSHPEKNKKSILVEEIKKSVDLLKVL